MDHQSATVGASRYGQATLHGGLGDTLRSKSMRQIPSLDALEQSSSRKWWYAGAGQRFSGSADMLLGVLEQNVMPVTSGSCAPGYYPFAPGNLRNQCDMFHFWSLHENGAHFLFADGSVRFLSYSAAPIMPALASRDGGEVVDIP